MTARAGFAVFSIFLLAMPTQAAPHWTPLFNGKNLDNFDICVTGWQYVLGRCT